MAKKSNSNSNKIAQNKRARFDYHIDETFERRMQLHGWAKSIRAGKHNLSDTYVIIRNGEAYFKFTTTPLDTASTHVIADPTHAKTASPQKELATIHGALSQKGIHVYHFSNVLGRVR